jgi:hypothetical protein
MRHQIFDGNGKFFGGKEFYWSQYNHHSEYGEIFAGTSSGSTNQTFRSG